MINLTHLIELEKKATQKKWNVGYSDGSGTYSDDEDKFAIAAGKKTVFHAYISLNKFDSEFITAIRNAAPALLAELVELRELKIECEYLDAYFGEQREIVLHRNDISKLFTVLNRPRKQTTNDGEL